MKRINIEKLENNIEQIALYDLERDNVFGCSYMVCQNGETVCKKHFGVSDWEEKAPVNDNTLFRIGSMTKPIVAAAILNLVDRYVISLDTPVKSVLPEFHNIHIISETGEDLGVNKVEMTIKHLLTHTSGFGSLKAVNMTPKEKTTKEKTVKYFIKQGLDFEPFSNEAYSTYASFDVLALILEKVLGEELEEFLKREIFTPCNMNNTTFILNEDEWTRVIDMHDRKKGLAGKNMVFDMYKNCVFEDFPMTHKLAGAGLVSTLEDYSHFSEMLLALPCIEHKPEIKLSLVFSVLEDEHFNDFFLQQLCLLLKNLPMAIWENVQSRLIDLIEIKYYLFSRVQMLSLAYTIELMNAKNYNGAYEIANLIYERIPIENDFIEFSEEDIRIRLAKLAYSTGRYNINEKINSIMTIKSTLKKADCHFLLGIVHYYIALCLAISGCHYKDKSEKDYFKKSYNKGFPLSETYLQHHNF